MKTTPSKTVAILYCRGARPENYVITALARFWREEGIQVHSLFGTGTHVPADVLILQVDLSVLPESVIRFASRYPRVVNGRVHDIRKSTFSTLRVTRDSGHQGPVIVKTDLNCGGRPEGRFHPNPFYRLHCLWQFGKLRHLARATGSFLYPVYSSVKEVPAACWSNPNWVVEKFVPERSGTSHVVRTYHFLGERDAFFLLKSPDPIVKSSDLVEVEPMEPDPRLRELRRKLGFDYGKFDYVLVDGEPVLLDLNKTTGMTSRFLNDPSLEAPRRERARGIHEFFA